MVNSQFKTKTTSKLTSRPFWQRIQLNVYRIESFYFPMVMSVVMSLIIVLICLLFHRELYPQKPCLNSLSLWFFNIEPLVWTGSKVKSDLTLLWTITYSNPKQYKDSNYKKLLLFSLKKKKFKALLETLHYVTMTSVFEKAMNQTLFIYTNHVWFPFTYLHTQNLKKTLFSFNLWIGLDLRLKFVGCFTMF